MTDSHENAFPLTTTTVDPATHHWTPQVQRAFLEALAVEGSVRRACVTAGKSWRTAYALRMQARGTAFRLGWDGAVLIARARLADDLMERAFEGQEESIMRNGDTIIRRKIDNRLAMSLLSRLDKMAETPCARGSDISFAQIIAQDFEAFLDLIEGDGDGPAAVAFIAARTPAPPPAKVEKAREIRGPGQCDLLTKTLLEQQGFDSIAERTERMGYWYNDHAEQWRTNFPAREGFDGDEDGTFGEPGFDRSIDEEEEALIERARAKLNADIEAAGRTMRDEFLYPEAFTPEQWEALG
jgi:hypothetical protein